MKRFLLSTLFIASAVPALAADLPAKAPPMMPVAAPVLLWDGFYIGLNGGYSWGRSRTNVSYFNTLNGAPILGALGSVTDAGFNLNGGVFGGQIGYNWQSSMWVFGIETDLQWSGQRGGGAFTCAATSVIIPGACFPGSTFLPAGTVGVGLQVDQKLEWFGTFRGRLGLLASPSTLLYVTGGLAYGGVKTDMLLTSITAAGLAASAATSNSTTHAGWTIGGGIEAMFGGNWSGKAEYLYMDLGTYNNNVTLPVAIIGANINSRITDNIFRVGINYHFSPPPAVVARY